MTQIKVVCPHCGMLEVRQIDTYPYRGKPYKCYETECAYLWGNKRQHEPYKIILDRVECLACNCEDIKVFPINKTKKQAKKWARNVKEMLKM